MLRPVYQGQGISDSIVGSLDKVNKVDERDRHSEHIKMQEYAAARMLLEWTKNGKERLSIGALGRFTAEDYSRIADMFCWKDFHYGDSLVMVGCGPLPVTLLHVADRYPTLNIHGLDSDKESIEVARQVLDVFAVAKAELLHTDGAAYNYAHAKIIYVANLVYPKSAVFKQISRSRCSGALVILRDPTESGTHLAGVGLNGIDENLVRLCREHVQQLRAWYECIEEEATAMRTLLSSAPSKDIDDYMAMRYPLTAIHTDWFKVHMRGKTACLLIGSGAFPSTALLLLEQTELALHCIDRVDRSCHLGERILVET
jgi:hypothetical protein